MDTSNKFHLSVNAAQAYEAQKVPALFMPLAEATMDAADLPPNARVIDVATGTGVIPKLLTGRVSGEAWIVGTDLNPAMIDVAQGTMPASHHKTEWHACSVTELPFADGSFDAAFCQQGLQFFPDKPAALREILRVLAPKGMLFLTCWKEVSLFAQATSASLRRRVSEDAAEMPLRPWSYRDRDQISELIRSAGFDIVDNSTLVIDRVLSPARAAIREEILASPYGNELTSRGETIINDVVDDIEAELNALRRADQIVLQEQAHLIQARRPV